MTTTVKFLNYLAGPIARRTIALWLLACAIGFASQPADGAPLISLGKQYAYLQNLPGQDAVNYRDDAHVQALGVANFSTGDLTDGVLQIGSSFGTGAPVVGWYNNTSVPVPADIIFNLLDTYLIESITLGTYRNIGVGQSTPDDVDILFSTTGTAVGDFSNLVHVNFPTISDGRADFPVIIPNIKARYVKLSFNGGTGDQPNREKYMLDEVSIFGAPPVPEPSTLALLGLGAIGMAIKVRRRRSIA